MQNRWETEILQHEAPKTGTPGRTRDRWAPPNDAQNSLHDTNRSATAPQSKSKSVCEINFDSIQFISSGKTVNIC